MVTFDQLMLPLMKALVSASQQTTWPGTANDVGLWLSYTDSNA